MELQKNETTMDLFAIQNESASIEIPLQKIGDEESSDSHIVDIDKWAASLSRILEDVPHYMCKPGHPGRVGKIPENLRSVDVKSYEPYFLSIGPYYHGKPSVQRMEKTKKCVLKWVLEQKPEVTLKDYLNEIKSVEASVRSFYSDVEMESEEFVRMLLLDSLYIVTVFCGMAINQESMNHRNSNAENNMDNPDATESSDQIYRGEGIGDDTSMEMIHIEETFEPRWLWILLEHDLLLLENQLPLFVIQKVHKLVYGASETQLLVNLKNALNTLLTHYTSIDTEKVILQAKDVYHLLHLCHMFFRPTIINDSVIRHLPESSQMFRLGSAVQLYQEGVCFEARSGPTQHTLVDITVDSQWNDGKVYMPCLYVEDNTISLLRNLIALEQMKYPSLGLDVSAYAVLLLHLITIPEDVKLLRRKGIIHHHLASDKEMVRLINRLSVGLSFDYVEDNYHLKPVFQELKRYSERKVPKWTAWLKHR